MSGNEVSRNLELFIKDLDPKYIQEGIEKSCMQIANTAKGKAPADTGTLRRSIDFKAEETEGVVFSNLEYAPYVEVGTGIYSTKGNGRKTPWKVKSRHGWFTTKGMKAQPFLKPAADESRRDLLKNFERLV